MVFIERIRKNKKSIFKHTIWIAGIVVFCAILEGFVFNLGFFSRNEESKKNIEITGWTFEESQNKDKAKIYKVDIPFDGYVDKLKIKYKTSKDLNTTLTYKYVGLYEKEQEELVDFSIKERLDTEIIYIGKNVKSFSIEGEALEENDLKIESISVLNGYTFNYYRMILCVAFLVSIYAIFRFWKAGFKTDRIHVYFCILASIIGITITIIQPVSTFISMDDETHFARVLQILGGRTNYGYAEWQMIGMTGNIGIGLPNTIEEQEAHINALNSNNVTNEEQFTATRRLEFYKLSYLPSVIGYHAAKLIGLPFSVCFIIGKIFNLILYIAMMTYAIKIAFFGKRVLFVVALLPTSIFLASNYSYDPCVTGGIAIFLVHLFNLLLDKNKKVNKRDIIIMSLSMIYACSAKMVYIPIVLLTLFIPKEKFPNKTYKKWFVVAMIITTLFAVSTFLWSLVGGNLTDARGGDTSAVEQLRGIITHPLDYIAVLKDTFYAKFFDKLIGNSTLGALGYLGNISSNGYFLILLMLIFTVITDNKSNNLSKKIKFSMIAVAVCIMLIIWSTLYLSFTPVGLSTINGVQNRYFIPLILLLFPCLQSPKINCNISDKKYNTVLTIIAITVLYSTIFNLEFNVFCL